MNSNSFLTIQSPVTGLCKEKGSRFLSFAYPVESEQEIKDQLKALRKEYFDARHHAYAYRLGAEALKFRAVDDGEPSHSAGDPILGQIRSRNLTGVLVVVVRYFGGVKLGVGGLIGAYKMAAQDALQKARIIEKDVLEEFVAEYDFSATPEVMKMIKEFDIRIVEQNFDSSCKLSLAIKRRHRNAWTEKIQWFNAIGVKIEIKELNK